MNTLTRTENKNGSFTYVVTNEAGEVITSRKSNNGNYIACSPEGNFYFSRLDLIGKGDSGRFFANRPEARANVAHLKSITTTVTFEMVNEEARELSVKLANTMYVIKRGNSLYTTMAKEEGEVLATWKAGNKIN